jgi:hypothetical protein
MSFYFELEQDFSRKPHSLADGSRVIEFALGYDLEADLIVVMSVMLIPDESGAQELCFGVRVKNVLHASVSPPDYSHTAAQSYVPKAARGIVLEYVLEATKNLLKSAMPNQVVMETFHSHLPPKAMEKYAKIVGVLTDCRYSVARQFRDETDGKDYWLFVANGFPKRPRRRGDVTNSLIAVAAALIGIALGRRMRRLIEKSDRMSYIQVMEAIC